MRKIDADALKQNILNAFGIPNSTFLFMAERRIFEQIDKMPTIEPERKPGKWYKPCGMMPPEYAGVYRCSECDGFAMRDWKRHTQILTNFCPNCGADMGDENEQ